ncbi:unnamed protein product, partial [marine sediment metagenome]
MKHMDDPLLLSGSPLAQLPAAKAIGERVYRDSLMAEGHALQELLQVSLDWAIAELRGTGRSAQAAHFLSPYCDTPNVTQVAERMGRSREHVSRYYRPLAFELVTKAFLKLTQDTTGKRLEQVASRLCDDSGPRHSMQQESWTGVRPDAQADSVHRRLRV